MKAGMYALATTPLFGIEAGSGAPVVCLHGITANAYVFAPIVEMLRDTFRVVSVDQRGHGRSSRGSGYDAEDYAADVAALVDALGGEPAILLGHSLGARNALACAVRHPERVRAVVAVDFTPFIETEVFDALEERVKGGDRVFDDLAQVEAYLAQRYPLIPADAIRRRATYGYRRHDDGYRALADAAAMAQTVTGLRTSLEDTVRRIDRPTVLVRGVQSRLVSPAAWAQTRASRPDLDAVEVDGADHYVPEERPDAIAELVRRAATM